MVLLRVNDEHSRRADNAVVDVGPGARDPTIVEHMHSLSRESVEPVPQKVVNADATVPVCGHG